MRIAVSGSHATGKSTLVSELARVLPRYHVVDEPYYVLLDEGHVFASEPAAEDFERQLERAIALVADDSGRDVLFDRCPADYCAYLAAIGPDMLRRVSARHRRTRESY